MTKLEELKAAYVAANNNADAADAACDDAYAARVADLAAAKALLKSARDAVRVADAYYAREAANTAANDAWSAYHAELKKEQTNEL